MDQHEEDALVEKVGALIKPYGCTVTGIGADSVGVQGDARAYGASLTVRFPAGATCEQISAISTMVINETRGVVRILLDIGSEGR